MLHKPTHSRSRCAQRTAGITLDHAAPLYDWLAPVMTLGLESRIHRHVLRSLALPQAHAVLDVGCGTGTLTRQVFDALPDDSGREVVGVDAAEAMVERARRKAVDRPGLRFDAALAEDLPYPADSFDRVVSTFFFHHLNLGLKQRALAEFWRVLRPGGRAVIVDVDVPYTRFGALCAYAGYWLFRQVEIKENIDGQLRAAIANSPFGATWRLASRHAGYLGLFELEKPA